MAKKLVDPDGNEVLAPQPGAQTDFMSSQADIVIYGGGAFTGKSYLSTLEATRNVGDKFYTAGMFRKQSIEIMMAGGLWDTASRIFPSVRGVPNRGHYYWKFPSGCRAEYHHLSNPETYKTFQGSAFVYLMFDELTHFSQQEFFYLISRNRPPTGCKLKPYCRATCNPEPGWVAELIQWWWNPETGYPIKERSGVIRHFIRDGNEIKWVSPDYRDKDGDPPKSLTFIAATLADNPIGTEADPTYRANLKTQDYVTRERLLYGNWLLDYGGNMFKPEWLPVIEPEEVPIDIKLVRYWDFAASEVKEADKDDPDWTAGALCGIHDGIFYIVDVIFFRESPGTTEVKVKDCAQTDGRSVEVWWEEEKGSAGRFTSTYMKQVLKGFDAHEDPVSGSKVERARPWSAWAERGKVKLVRGEWNRQFKTWASKFPQGKRDCIDAASGSFRVLTGPDRVFKYYIPDAQHNLKKFSREKEDFEKITQGNIDVYITLWATEEGAIYGAFWVYSKVSKRLRLYNEMAHLEPIAWMAADAIKEKAVVPMYDKPNFVTVKGIYCNDLMLEKGKNHMAKELRKYGIRPRTLKVYDERGSVLTLNRMMATGNFIVHPECVESDVQIRGWMYKNGKFDTGFPLARCACLITSQLRGDMAKEEIPILPAYSRQKMALREKLRSNNSPEGVVVDI